MVNQENLYVQACEQRDDARAQLAEMATRVAVLEAALRAVVSEDWQAHTAEAALATPSPLAAAVGEVVKAALRMKTVWSHYGATVEGENIISDAENTFREKVKALRTLAPWWST